MICLSLSFSLSCERFGLECVLHSVKPFFVMSKKRFREHAALHILTVLLDKTTNPVEAAVFWANELVRELYDEKKSNNRHRP